MGFLSGLKAMADKTKLPGFMGGIMHSVAGWSDTFRSKREPTPTELVDEYRSVAYICATINATAVAQVTPLLYRVTKKSERTKSHWQTKEVSRYQQDFLQRSRLIPRRAKAYGDHVEEVLDHPVLSLLENVNPFHNGFTLREMTSLYLDIIGTCYYYLPRNLLGLPEAIWIVPAQNVTPMGDASNPLTHYEITGADGKNQNINPQMLIPFLMPNLKEPYLHGWAPARAAIEILNSVNEDIALNYATMKNRNRPDLWVAPKEQTGFAEAERIKRRVQQMFSQSRAGGVIVASQNIDIKPLQTAPKDLESLARLKMNSDMMKNAFGVPLPLLSENTNMANLRAALVLHGKYAVLPRVTRIFETLNQNLIPLYDPTGQLFLSFENPVPEDAKEASLIRAANIKAKIRTPDEERMRMPCPEDPLPEGAGAQIFVSSGELQWSPKLNDALTENAGQKPLTSGQNGGNDKKPEKDPKKPKKPQPSKGLDPDHRNSLMLASEAVVALYMGLSTAGKAIKALRLTKKLTDESINRIVNPKADANPFTGCCEKSNNPLRIIPEGEQIERRLKAFFRKQSIAVLGGFKQWQKGAFDPVDLSAWDAELASLMQPVLAMHYSEELKSVLTRYGAGKITNADELFNITNPRIKDALERQAIVLAESTNATTTLSINEAIRQLKQELAEGLLSPEFSTLTLTERVKKVFVNAEDWRAKMIARTEASRAIHSAQRIAANDSGVVKGFEWLLSEDACPFCKEIAAKHKAGIELNGTFGLASEYKAGPKTSHPEYNTIYGPPAHPNCRCAMLEIIDFKE